MYENGSEVPLRPKGTATNLPIRNPENAVIGHPGMVMPSGQVKIIGKCWTEAIRKPIRAAAPFHSTTVGSPVITAEWAAVEVAVVDVVRWNDDAAQNITFTKQRRMWAERNHLEALLYIKEKGNIWWEANSRLRNVNDSRRCEQVIAIAACQKFTPFRRQMWRGQDKFVSKRYSELPSPLNSRRYAKSALAN